MGCWNSSCLISGLPVEDQDEVYVMLVDREADYAKVEKYVVISPPLLAIADDYGQFSVTETNPVVIDRYRAACAQYSGRPSRFESDNDDSEDFIAKGLPSSLVLNGQNNTIMILKSVYDHIMADKSCFWLWYPQTYRDHVLRGITVDFTDPEVRLSLFSGHYAIESVGYSLIDSLAPYRIYDNPDQADAIMECWDRLKAVMTILMEARRPIAPNPHVGNQHGGYEMIEKIGQIAATLRNERDEDIPFDFPDDESDIVGVPITEELRDLIIAQGSERRFGDAHDWLSGPIAQCRMFHWNGLIVVMSLDENRAEFAK